ncbi:ABC transporter [Cryptosporangium phraense]|uniref:ABC transporter n=1 Tax=Cryptosporangium phraense TaxID=2593070 RepID=UPI001478E639|nr:ABC transporter [Cryptosporangium phraense]
MTAAVSFEWVKLRTLRSTWWCAGVAVLLQGLYALLLGIDARADLEHGGGPSDLVVGDAGLLSVQFAQYALIAAALLAVTGEYSSGTIGVTLRAVPVRARMLAAKAAVVAAGAAGLAAVLMLLAAVAGGLAAGSYARWEVGGLLGDTALVAGYAAALAVFALGLGTAVRSAVGGLTVVLVVAVVLPTVLARISLSAVADLNDYLPGSAGTAVLYGALSDPQPPQPYGPGIGLLVFAAWGAAALAAGYAVLRHRDA